MYPRFSLSPTCSLIATSSFSFIVSKKPDFLISLRYFFSSELPNSACISVKSISFIVSFSYCYVHSCAFTSVGGFELKFNWSQFGFELLEKLVQDQIGCTNSGQNRIVF